MKSKDWKKCIVGSTSSLREAVRVLNEGALQIALVVDQDNKLKGVLTDGDFRRAVLAGISIDASVINVMNPQPTVLRLGEPKEKALQLMKAKEIHQIPVVDELGRVHNVYTIDNLYKSEAKENEVVLMAGGLGSRLKDLTKDTPKPLLKVGGRPLIETMVLNLKEQGFVKFVFCVNYLSEQLKEYFGDGSSLGVQIRYVEERKRLGTAGALRITDIDSKHPVIVMNGDILTNLDFNQFLQFHRNEQHSATMAVRRFESQIPYGVIEMDNSKIISMQEKPVNSYFINAGIYCFNPEVFKSIPQDEYFDMNQFFTSLLAAKEKVGAFPVSDYWIDIGHLDDYERANLDFPIHFKSE